MKHNELIGLIPFGEDNAISMNRLSSLLGVDQREVRLLIQNARISGIIIAGSDQGIFRPQTLDELRRYIRRTESRITTSMQTLAPALKLLEFWEDDDDEV